MAEPSDLDDLLDIANRASFRAELTKTTNTAARSGRPHEKGVVDFTFRLPPSVLEVIREMARYQGCSVNAMVAGLVGIGLQSRGRPGLAETHLEYLEYLSRGRRGTA